MSTYKLTPLEQLIAEKKRIREERSTSGQRLAYQIQYINDNWGSLITRGIMSSVKNKIFETVDGISSNSGSSFVTKPRHTWLNFAIANLPLLSSVAWSVAKPTLMSFALKKAMSMLFRRKRR